jgi:cell fate regulator YaaT (PSP1 superfamily)
VTSGADNTRMTPLPDLPSRPPVLVRHGRMRFLGVFVPAMGLTVRRRDSVVVRGERGQELGEVLCPATPEAVAAIPDPTKGDILRVVAPEDRAKQAHLADQEQKEFATGQKLIAQHKLAMQLVDVEHLFGGERIVFYFLAESRVDFRELVRSMAREFHTRIELRQIGVRDEARIKADYGDCGRPVCCNTFLVTMPPVSMRMAKLQKSTLDPAKISGRCGRLKCCLRFEQDVYEEFQAALPPVNARVLTRNGQGRVLAQEVLARKVLVEFEDGRRLPVSADDILTRMGEGKR